ncbi:MAG: glycoside hydrolase family 97 catalytic domain-containing protein [Lachnospiraceae bacterium]|nr:glycoside hydrolase family 97 catalytic domain-containing protein [Lachnospiraceae bacterium]
MKKRKWHSIVAAAMAAVMVAGTLFTAGGMRAIKADEITGSESVYADGTVLTKVYEAASPEGTMTAVIWTDEATGRYFYSANCSGETVLEAAQLGLVTEAEDLSTGLTLADDSYSIDEVNDTYSLVGGGISEASDTGTEVTFDLTKGTQTMTITLRVYEDAVAYRYTVADAGGAEAATITGEVSEFLLPTDATIWYSSMSDTYEGTYASLSVSDLYARALSASTPVLANVSGSESDFWVLLTEANVFNEDETYCASTFSSAVNSKSLTWTFGNHQGSTVKMTYPFHTPWRVAIIGTTLDDTTNSTVLTSLNPAASEDIDWSFVDPGVAAWSWWSTTSDAIEPDTQKDYIDFAAENGWEYVLVDYGWELWDNYADEVEELAGYAAEKGIGIFLWYGVDKYDGTHIFDLDDVETIEEQFAWCEEIGVRGVKIDYINSDSQEAMTVMNEIASIAAEHELMVVFHGCTNPNGEERTYPNVVSWEAVKGEEYFKWGIGADLETLLTYLFTRNALGSMDFTPAVYQMTTLDATTGFQLAMSVVYESAVQHFAHSAYVYEGTAQLSFLNDVPTAWDESYVDGYPGEWNLAARRSGEDWYLGVMTASAGAREIALDFLGDGTYTAYIYEDNEDGSAVVIRTEEVTRDDTLTLDLLTNGGAAVKITQNGMTTTAASDAYTYYEAENATLGGATTRDDNNYASGLKSVGWVGNGAANSVTFENVAADEAGYYELKIYYITGEARNLYVRVNDDEGTCLSGLTATRDDWSAVGRTSITVYLEAGTNTISLYNATAYAPSIDRIAVSLQTVNPEEFAEEADQATSDDSQNETTVADGEDNIEAETTTEEDAAKDTDADDSEKENGNTWIRILLVAVLCVACAAVVAVCAVTKKHKAEKKRKTE